LRRSRLNEKVNRRTDGRRTNCDGNGSGKLKRQFWRFLFICQK